MNLEQELHEMPLDAERGLDQMLHEGRRRVENALRKHRRPLARAGVIDTPLGELLVAEGPRGIVAIHFLDTKGAGNPIPALREKFDVVEDQRAAERIGEEIRRFIAGDPGALRHRIDLSLVDSVFQRRAYLKLRQVPLGSVVTYQGLAAAVGAPDGQRAIGNTMATNPVPIYVPCHRVIRSDGSIGNYGGGVARKVKLLRLEGFEVGPDLRVPARAVFGHQRTHIFCRPQCSAAMRADRGRMVIFADPERARRAGLRACKLCRPA
jgi:methylated-DNA-[protein]-cysteine S-methyltransferase